MFDFFYKNFKITEKDFSKNAIRRLRLFSTVLLLATPIFTLAVYLDLPEKITNVIFPVMTVIVFFLLVIIGTNRIAMTLSRTDKNLDEWEIDIKRRAESFAYRFMMLVGIALLAYIAFNESSLGGGLSGAVLGMSDIYYICINMMVPSMLLPIVYTAWMQKPLKP